MAKLLMPVLAIILCSWTVRYIAGVGDAVLRGPRKYVADTTTLDTSMGPRLSEGVTGHYSRPAQRFFAAADPVSAEARLHSYSDRVSFIFSGPPQCGGPEY